MTSGQTRGNTRKNVASDVAAGFSIPYDRRMSSPRSELTEPFPRRRLSCAAWVRRPSPPWPRAGCWPACGRSGCSRSCTPTPTRQPQRALLRRRRLPARGAREPRRLPEGPPDRGEHTRSTPASTTCSTTCASPPARRAPFQVISAYRSPRTNAMLRGHGGGVAKGSLHLQGRAIDVRLADVALRVAARRRGRAAARRRRLLPRPRLRPRGHGPRPPLVAGAGRRAPCAVPVSAARSPWAARRRATTRTRRRPSTAAARPRAATRPAACAS